MIGPVQTVRWYHESGKETSRMLSEFDSHEWKNWWHHSLKYKHGKWVMFWRGHRRWSLQEVYEIDINMFDLGKFEIPNRISGRRVESGGVLTRDVGYLTSQHVQHPHMGYNGQGMDVLIRACHYFHIICNHFKLHRGSSIITPVMKIQADPELSCQFCIIKNH